jgi:V8-like Glu-specific endopeptidase
VKSPCVALVLLAACAATRAPADVSEQTSAIVYDDDGRHEVYEAQDPLRRVAALSVAAIIPKQALTVRSSTDPVQIASSTLQEAYALCDGERFLEQPTAAVCSAVLVDENLALTAAHCMARPNACHDLAFVFDYYYRSAGVLERVGANDVFTCRRVVARASGDLDYAFVELEGPAALRQPVGVSTQALDLEHTFSIVGTPSGLPLKVEAEVEVLNPSIGPGRFAVASDTFEGSSGSGVFDRGGQLVGIVSRGAADYMASDAGCQVPNRVSSSDPPGGGEQVIQLAPLLAELCASGWSSDTLCPAPDCADDCTPDAGLAPEPDAEAEEAEDPSDAASPPLRASAEPGCVLAAGDSPPRTLFSAWLTLLTGLFLARRRAVAVGIAHDFARRVRSS